MLCYEKLIKRQFFSCKVLTFLEKIVFAFHVQRMMFSFHQNTNFVSYSTKEPFFSLVSITKFEVHLNLHRMPFSSMKLLSTENAF